MKAIDRKANIRTSFTVFSGFNLRKRRRHTKSLVCGVAVGLLKESLVVVTEIIIAGNNGHCLISPRTRQTRIKA
ncbi:unnamed protein product [Coffea canephora]|uniref:DH200=94 genomic scaffold, scaffold_214 n=1 Tax=Coffea canephora TaxID=49390 RepID=A0A068VEK6_COFCA|nr:unnamed protein product [Coffea canephora]